MWAVSLPFFGFCFVFILDFSKCSWENFGTMPDRLDRDQSGALFGDRRAKTKPQDYQNLTWSKSERLSVLQELSQSCHRCGTFFFYWRAAESMGGARSEFLQSFHAK